MGNSINDRSHVGEIVTLKALGGGAYLLRITVRGGLDFIPGQYVWLCFPVLKYADPHGERRAFSIANIPNAAGEIEVIFRRSESGFMRALSELQSGDELQVIGPFGSAFTPANIDKGGDLIMIAGGTGLSPFLSLVRYFAAEKKSVKVSLIYFYSVEMASFAQELTELENKNKFFKVYLRATGEKFSWNDLPSGVDPHTARFFISGPPAMIDEVSDILNANGVFNDQINFEGAYPTNKYSKILANALKGNNNAHVNLEFGSSDIFRAAVNSSSNHIAITDVNGVVVYANAAAQEITGYSMAEMEGNTPRLWGGMMDAEFYKKIWRSKALGIDFSGELINRRKNGEIYYVVSHISPIKTTADEIIGFISTEEDISKEKMRSRELEELNSRLELAAGAARIGILDWDMKDNRMIWDGAMFKIYGIKPEEFKNTYESWEKMIYPDDLAEVRNNIGAAIKNKTLLDTNCRIFVSGGTTIRHIKLNGTVVRDENGGPVKMIVVNRDFTKEFEVDKAKTEFISLASHQMRTPLIAISWNVEMLRDVKIGALNHKQTEYVQAIDEQSKQMKELIDALLNVSRLELGTFVIEAVSIDIVEQCRSVVRELEPLRLQKGHSLNLNIAKKVPIIPADPNLVRIIFQNLISNAIKYTPTNGNITVSIEARGAGDVIEGKRLKRDVILISVADNGLGIPTADYPKVFLRMFRSDNVRQVEGTGLGLYIVKLILEAVDGEIWFQSAESKGTTFYVALPLDGMKKKGGTKKISSTT